VRGRTVSTLHQPVRSVVAPRAGSAACPWDAHSGADFVWPPMRRFA